ncbi:MAG TPA: hypothetical protein VMK12_25045 [Anaeromyxobacteraceae bacterium]|nr:hypothetical protein [Anaeromyxobacteraceae bacterium]
MTAEDAAPAPRGAPRHAHWRGGLLLLALLASPAAADPARLVAPTPASSPETRSFHYSDYEKATIETALASLGFSRDAEPEGKAVESIHVVRLEVIETRDPAPRILNVFHVLTNSDIIEREVLLRKGAPYRQTLADETRRNLSTIPQLSLALVVAARGTRSDAVRIIVITKDVWSLRLNWNIAFGSHGLESLTAEPAETNFLGTLQTIGLLFDLLPESYSVGAQYSVPRILGSHLALVASGGLIFNRTSGAREGSFGNLQLSYPLWTSRTEWSYGAGVSWLDELTRTYVDGSVARFTLKQATCNDPSSFCVPEVYRTNTLDAAAFVTRSYGWARKHDFSIGFEGLRSHYGLPDLSAYDPATVQAFDRALVPVSDDRVGPYLQYRTYSNDFLRVLDLETLALQEDYRLGREAYLRFYPVLRILGSSRDFLGTTAGLSYTSPLGDGLMRAGVDTVTEVEPGKGRVSDGSIQATFRLASPRWLLGRLVFDSVLLDRYANYLNRTSYLGGDTRLRGFPSQFFFGSDVLAANVEYRSKPLELFRSVQVGGVAFFDTGDAFDSWKQLHMWQALGFGTRILLPQFDRVVFRIDVSFPLARPTGQGLAPMALFVSFGQAFSLYEIAPATAVTR